MTILQPLNETLTTVFLSIAVVLALTTLLLVYKLLKAPLPGGKPEAAEAAAEATRREGAAGGAAAQPQGGGSEQGPGCEDYSWIYRLGEGKRGRDND